MRRALQLEKESDEEYEVKGLGEFWGISWSDLVTGGDQVLLNMVDRGLLYIAKDTGPRKFFRVKNPSLISEVSSLVGKLSEEETKNDDGQQSNRMG